MIAIAIALLGQAATPPPATSPTTSAPAARSPAAKPPAAKEKLVCVDEPVLGSRLGGHRICRTAAEWQRDRREGQDDVERAQRLAKLPGQE